MTARFPGLEAVVFDLDGTLVDSAPDIAAAANVALTMAGLSPLPVDAIVRMVGNGSEVLIARALERSLGSAPSSDLVDDTHADFLTAYAAAPCVATQLYPNALTVLNDLRQAGVKIAICTNKPQSITLQVLQALELSDHFDSIVGSTADRPLKPAPDMLLLALKAAGATPSASVMVGDSRADAGTARAAGTKLVLLRHGYSTDDVATLGADAVLPDFGSFSETLRQMTAAAASPI